VAFVNQGTRIVLCNEALNGVRELIPTDLYIDVSDYINKFDEWGIGMELLVNQLAEYEIQISVEQFEKIKEAFSSMDQADTDDLAYLWKHNVHHT
jgi:hypothetical protein